jgi:TonB family protein
MRVARIGLLLLAGGCARPRAVDPLTVPSAPALEEHRGEVQARFLRDPEISAPAATAELISSPRPLRDLPLPQYPQAALEAGAGAAHVVVRIVIGTDGRLTDVRDSPREASSLGPFMDEFRDAVLRALRHWRFTPGMRRSEEAGVAGATAVAVYYDVRFDFDIVDGIGQVRMP